MKIKAIDIQNFQGHTLTRVPLKDFNIIIGKSSSGKSSIFRAVKFLLYGEWDKTYQQNNEKPAAVALLLSNNNKIIRMKDEKNNKALIDNTLEKIKYHSFGDEIPGIFDLINLKEIDINGKKVNLNISMQDDPLFLLSESKQNKALWIGRLYGAHIINSAIKSMTKEKNSKNTELKIINESITKLEEELKEYDTVEQQKQILKEAEEVHAKTLVLKDIRSKLISIKTIEKNIHDKEEILNKVNINRMKEIVARLIQLTGIRTERDKTNNIKKLIDKNKPVLNLDVDDIKNKIQRLSKLKEIQTSYNKLKIEGKKIKKYLPIRDIDIKSIQDIISKLKLAKEAKNNIDRIEKEIIKYEDQLDNILEELKIKKNDIKEKMFSGNKCPICNNDISHIDSNCLIENIRKLK